MVFEIIGFKELQKSPSLSKLWGNVGPTILAKGGYRFEADCNIYEIFIQIGQLVRKISTD